MSEIIRVANLCKTFKIPRRENGLRGTLSHLFTPRYKYVTAVDGVTFGIQPGELVGYLGPNGAGKSTTIKMLTGLLVPSSGELNIHGMVPWKQRARYVEDIGAVFGQRVTLWWDLPLMDSFELIKPMYHMKEDRYQQNMKLLCDLLGLDEFIHAPVRSLSLGQRMRAELGAALVHDPKLLFLDEPTIGLDVVAKERIRSFIQYVNRERGTTILLTTHDLTDVERLCERVIILDHGHLLYDGKLARLIDQFEDHRVLVVNFSDQVPDIALAGLGKPVIEGQQAIYRFDHRKVSPAEVLAKLNGEHAFTDIEIRRPPIEETIRRIYEEELLLPDDE